MQGPGHRLLDTGSKTQVAGDRIQDLQVVGDKVQDINISPKESASPASGLHEGDISPQEEPRRGKSSLAPDG